MGLLDELSGGLLGRLFGGGNSQKLIETVIGLISNQQTGGLPGLVQVFKEKGLGELMGSWISTGQNLPVSGEQIGRVFGMEQLGQIARSLGVSQDEASNGLAGLLPEIIDRLTPDGRVPDSDALQQGLSVLKGKLLNL